MFKAEVYQFRNLYSKLSKSVAESIFILCFFCIRIVVLLGAFVFLLALAFAPALYLWNYLDFLAVSSWGKVVFAVLWTLLWGLSLLLLNFLIHPLIERIAQLYNNFNMIIDNWLIQEKLRKK